MRKFFLVILCLFLLRCGKGDSQFGSVETGIDPTFSWNAVTTYCDGTAASGITYNIYILPGVSPIPTETVDAAPCGSYVRADQSQIQPYNSTPITDTTFFAALPEGEYVVAVEAVSATGVRSGLSQQLFVTVVLVPSTPGGVGYNKALNLEWEEN